jgi:hypothetical protein
MDTNDETPAGVDDITPSEDTVADITQPEETGEVSATEPEESGEASLLAGKYKSPQELEKAYLEVQKTVGQVSQKAELANRLEKATGMSTQQIEDYLANQEYTQYQQQVQGNPGLAAYQEVQQLKSQIALQKEERDLDKFLSSEEGKPYTAQRDKILKLGLNLERDKDYGDIAREYFGESRAQGQQDAYRKIDTKRNSQATGVSQSPPKGRVTLEDLDNMSVKEMEAVLPHADLSNRL